MLVIDRDVLILSAYAIYLTIQLSISAHILFTKHEEPSSALLWLLLITLLPGLGIIFYLVFGINRLKSMGENVKAIQDKINDSKEKFLGATINNYLECFSSFKPDKAVMDGVCNRTLDNLMPDCVPLTGNQLELLKDGTMAYPRMLHDIMNAKNSIRLQSFIIMNDPIGREIFDALANRAKDGVDVKVLYDGFGSCKAYFSHFFQRYSHKKIKTLKIRAFSPINIFTPWRIQLRNHRKLLVIDGKIAFIGGINISQENARFKKVPRRKYIHDLHCRMRGPAVSLLQYNYLKDWLYATRRHFDANKSLGDFPPPEKQGDSIVRPVNSGPGENNEATQNVFLAAAAAAQKSLYIITPYFVPSPSFQKMLCITAARGIDVKIIVPKENNHFFVALASQSLYRTMLRHGVKIYEKRGLFSHAKAMLLDRSWAYMGSSNCDVRSFRLNYELDICVEQGEFLDQLVAQFDEELAGSDEVLLEHIEAKSLSMQMLENLCALLSPIL